jgi:hypothetical protein
VGSQEESRRITPELRLPVQRDEILWYDRSFLFLVTVNAGGSAIVVCVEFVLTRWRLRALDFIAVSSFSADFFGFDFVYVGL